MADTYHHGNLKNDLIEAAIQIISQEGFDRLSLRYLASKCGVSHNAIYRHYNSKEIMIAACRNYVTEKLTDQLSIVEANAGAEPYLRICALTHGFIEFYIAHPAYYSFLYRNASVKINLTLLETEDNYPPFEYFRQAFQDYGMQTNQLNETCLNRLTQLWAEMHGLIALAISPYVTWDGCWEMVIDDDLRRALQ